MKQQALDLVTNLDNFLMNIESIAKHPYSKGVDVEKLVKDLRDYCNDLREGIEKIEEVTEDFVGQPDSAEESSEA